MWIVSQGMSCTSTKRIPRSDLRGGDLWCYEFLLPVTSGSAQARVWCGMPRMVLFFAGDGLWFRQRNGESYQTLKDLLISMGCFQ